MSVSGKLLKPVLFSHLCFIVHNSDPPVLELFTLDR